MKKYITFYFIFFSVLVAWSKPPSLSTINKWERKLIYQASKLNVGSFKDAYTYPRELGRIFREMGEMYGKQQYEGAAKLGLQIYSHLNETVFSEKSGTGYACIFSNYEFYSWFLQRLSYSFNAQGLYNTALYYGLEAEKCWRQIKNSKKNDDAVDYMYAESTNNLATFYFNARDINEAKKWINICIEHTKDRPGYESLYYQVRNTEACLLDYEGLPDKALEIEYMILNKAPNVEPLWEENYIDFLYNCNKKDEAVKKTEVLLRKYKTQGQKEAIRYALCLNRLSVYKQDTDIIASISMEKEALDILKKQGNTLNHEYAKFLSNLARFYYKAGKKEDALSTEQRAYNIWVRIVPENNPERLSSLFMLSLCQYENHQWDSAERNMIRGTRFQDDNIRYSMLQSQVVRNNIWNKCKWWYIQAIPQFAYNIQSDSLCITAYNAALLAKGILLNTEQSLKDMAKNGDAQSKQLYKKWQESLRQLNSPHPAEKDEILRKEALVAEEKFIENCRTLKTAIKRLTVTWDDIQTKLRNNDIAVEFCSFEQDGRKRYMAIVLNKNMHSPKLIPLFDEEQLTSIEDKNVQRAASMLIWKPLSKYLNSAKNIYFAPSGELYKVAIENFPHWEEDCLMTDKWNIYRLSSTRELALDSGNHALKVASIYGGIKYNTKYKNNNERNNDRSDIMELPETKNEVENICELLKKHNIVTTIKTGIYATESDFKALSGKGNNLLHIATHGFFWAKNEDNGSIDSVFLMHEGNQTKNMEDKAMTRSGFFMAGAGNSYKGQMKTEDLDDGIVTAKEVSQMDLSDVDFVVLSACQTGLGEIGSDGVFGLQRGFKKAGARTLMMSLWKVDDEATQMLMTAFYQNLTSGKMSKYESLQQAQKYVREYEVKIPKDESYPQKGYDTLRRYENPIYWAAFILLDAVE